MWLFACHVLCLLQFDALQTCSGPSAPVRRPDCNTLLDVFENIRCAGLTPLQHVLIGRQPPRLQGSLRLHYSEGWVDSAKQWELPFTAVGYDVLPLAWAVLYCTVLPFMCRDDEIEHVKTMHACQDPAKIASDLRAMRNGNASS